MKRYNKIGTKLKEIENRKAHRVSTNKNQFFGNIYEIYKSLVRIAKNKEKGKMYKLPI